MADILGYGPDREPPRWTSPLALAAAGIVLVAVALLVRGIVDRPAAHRPAAASSAPSVAPPTEGSAVPFGVTVSRSVGSKEPTRFSGVATTSGVGRLLLTGPRPGWLQTATGRFQLIAGLPPWGTGYGFTRAADGWLAERFSPPQANCQVCEAPPAVYFIGGQSARATVVGAAYGAAAAVNRSDLWLTAYLPDADIAAASGTTEEVTVAGQGVGPPAELPAGYVIDRAVQGGLLLAAYAQGPGPVRDYLWDPVTAQLVREFTNVIAASPAQIAWDPCLGRCPLKILRLPAKAAMTVRLARRAWAVAGTFSSDGRLLAVQVTTQVQPDGSAATTRLEVINTVTGRLTVLPGTTINSLIGVSFGWQAGSDRLLAALALPSGAAELASWQPGDAHLSIQAVRLPTGTTPVLGDRG
jgi:hypothetical protein